MALPLICTPWPNTKMARKSTTGKAVASRRPTANHLPVIRYVHPDEFSAYRTLGLQKGFIEVVSGPLVRSSYRAERALEGNNVGLPTDRGR